MDRNNGRSNNGRPITKECLEWMHRCQADVEKTEYGISKEAVEQTLHNEQRRAEEIKQYSSHIHHVFEKVSHEEREHIKSSYMKLKAASQKKMNCLETVRDVATLQDLFVSMSMEVDHRAVELVERVKKNGNKFGHNLFGFIAPSAQNYVFATKSNWEWNRSLLQCIETHMKNASEYHQYFFEVEENIAWLRVDLKRIHASYQMSPLTGDYTNAQRLLREIQETTTALRQWRLKSDFMWKKAVKVVPIHQRITPISEPAPAIAIIDYATPTFQLRKDEDLLLLDNSNKHLWRVRNAEGEEGEVPSLAVVIPGQTNEAIKGAGRMRLQLMAAWTHAMKTIGKRLITFLLIVFKSHYDDEELHLLQTIGLTDRKNLVRILTYIENTLKTHWVEYEDFQHLQESILMLKMILEQTGYTNVQDSETFKVLVIQITTLEELMKKYQEMGGGFDATDGESDDDIHSSQFFHEEKQRRMYERVARTPSPTTTRVAVSQERTHSPTATRVAVSQETTHSPTTTRVAVSQATTGQREDSHSWQLFHEEKHRSVSESEQITHSSSTQRVEMFHATTRQTAEIEHLFSATGEERKMFEISYVRDPRAKKDVSLNKAIRTGIINLEKGTYELETGREIPIPEAIKYDYIKVLFTTTDHALEKRFTTGIITVKTIRTDRPYQIISAKDVRNRIILARENAIKQEIIDIRRNIYTNTETGEEMSIVCAANKGLVHIKYEGRGSEAEVRSCTYAIRAVVERRDEKLISYQDAVSRGIIDRESDYHDLSTGQVLPIDEAIMKGYVKARKLDDPKSIDIDPENILVVDKTEIYR